MKIFYLLIFALLLQSCGQDKKNLQLNNAASEIAFGGDTLHDRSESSREKKVVSVNFEALQKEYLQKKNDSIYIINFWATWCKPCVKELPAFEKIAKQYSNQPVKLLLVSLDFPDKIESQVIPFIKKNNIHSEIILLDDPDANSWIPKVSPDWSGAIPATIIYRNNTRKFYEKSFTFEELETELKPFL